MAYLSSRTVRYARAWVAGPHHFVEEEILLDREGVAVPATVVRPEGPTRGLSAWVVMHGITRPGRAHTQLVRFTRAVASAGIASIVPEVPEWRELRLAPHLSTPTIAAAVRGLRDTGLIRDAPVGLVGFSFGAAGAVLAASDEEVAEHIGGAVVFGQAVIGGDMTDGTLRWVSDDAFIIAYGSSSTSNPTDAQPYYVDTANQVSAVLDTIPGSYWIFHP